MRWSLPFACLLTLAAHAGSAADAGTPADAKAVSGQSATAPVSGVILANFDRSVRPQDDFYRFVNGTWLEKTQIPPDRSNYGMFQVLQDSIQQSLRAIAESAAADPGKAGSDRQMVGDLFASYMDEAAAERAGPGGAGEGIRGDRRDQGRGRAGRLLRPHAATPGHSATRRG